VEKKPKTSGNVFDLKVLKRLFGFMIPYKVVFYTIIALTLVGAISGPIKAVLIQYTIDNHVQSGNTSALLTMTFVLTGLLVTNAIIQYYHTYLSGWLGQHIIKDIRIQLYEHLLKFRLKFYDKTPIGRLITRNISDIETLSNVFSEGLAAIVSDMLQILVILGIMIYYSWKLTLVTLSVFPLLIIGTYIFKEKIKGSFNEVRTAVANLNTFVQEHITGMNIVQIFSSEERELKKFVQINEEHRISNLKSVLYYSVYFPVAEVIAAMCTGLLVWYGANRIMFVGDISIGVLTAFLLCISMFFRPIRMIADRFNTLQMGIVSADRIFKLLESQEDVADNGNITAEKMLGEVIFQNVSFAYEETNPVLKKISFEVKAGETLAIVGATGAGKSSIINLLNRFYDIDEGNILIDGIDVKKYDINSLRSKIAIVLQDVFLFSDTIGNNITLNNKEITEAKIWEAAELVGAKKFIEKLPGKLNFQVMERGANLSVGQRQLLSFIRALVFDPAIIVLDEATSSVDSETEEQIQNAVKKLLSGRTAIVIAHRLSTVQTANKILVLDKGEIKESGSHEELLQLNGFYSQLNAMQFKMAV
jgi:ATP-binding cassette subfamily B protein